MSQFTFSEQICLIQIRLTKKKQDLRILKRQFVKHFTFSIEITPLSVQIYNDHSKPCKICGVPRQTNARYVQCGNALDEYSGQTEQELSYSILISNIYNDIRLKVFCKQLMVRSLIKAIFCFGFTFKSVKLLRLFSSDKIKYITKMIS